MGKKSKSKSKQLSHPRHAAVRQPFDSLGVLAVFNDSEASSEVASLLDFGNVSKDYLINACGPSFSPGANGGLSGAHADELLKLLVDQEAYSEQRLSFNKSRRGSKRARAWAPYHAAILLNHLVRHQRFTPTVAQVQMLVKVLTVVPLWAEDELGERPLNLGDCEVESPARVIKSLLAAVSAYDGPSILHELKQSMSSLSLSHKSVQSRMRVLEAVAAVGCSSTAWTQHDGGTKTDCRHAALRLLRQEIEVITAKSSTDFSKEQARRYVSMLIRPITCLVFLGGHKQSPSTAHADTKFGKAWKAFVLRRFNSKWAQKTEGKISAAAKIAGGSESSEEEDGDYVSCYSTSDGESEGSVSDQEDENDGRFVKACSPADLGSSSKQTEGKLLEFEEYMCSGKPGITPAPLPETELHQLIDAFRHAVLADKFGPEEFDHTGFLDLCEAFGVAVNPNEPAAQAVTANVSIGWLPKCTAEEEIQLLEVRHCTRHDSRLRHIRFVQWASLVDETVTAAPFVKPGRIEPKETPQPKPEPQPQSQPQCQSDAKGEPENGEGEPEDEEGGDAIRATQETRAMHSILEPFASILPSLTKTIKEAQRRIKLKNQAALFTYETSVHDLVEDMNRAHDAVLSSALTAQDQQSHSIHQKKFMFQPDIFVGAIKRLSTPRVADSLRAKLWNFIGMLFELCPSNAVNFLADDNATRALLALGVGSAEDSGVERPVHQYSNSIAEHECSICLDTIDCDHAQVLPCGHFYHRTCIAQLRRDGVSEHAACPLCRANLPTYDEEYFVLQAIHQLCSGIVNAARTQGGWMGDGRVRASGWMIDPKLTGIINASRRAFSIAFPRCIAAFNTHSACDDTLASRETSVAFRVLSQIRYFSTEALSKLSSRVVWKHIRRLLAAKIAKSDFSEVTRSGLWFLRDLCEWVVPAAMHSKPDAQLLVKTAAKQLLQSGAVQLLLQVCSSQQQKCGKPTNKDESHDANLQVHVLALGCLAHLTRLQDARLLIAQLDDKSSEPGCSLLRAIEGPCEFASKIEPDVEQVISETLFVVMHLGWEPHWRARISSHHNLPLTAAKFARRLWKTHGFSIREGKSAHTSGKPKQRAISFFSAAVDSHGLRSLSRALASTGALGYEDEYISDILNEPLVLGLLVCCANHPWFEIRKSAVQTIQRIVQGGDNAEKLRKLLDYNQARVLVAALGDSLFYEHRYYGSAPYFEDLMGELAGGASSALSAMRASWADVIADVENHSRDSGAEGRKFTMRQERAQDRPKSTFSKSVQELARAVPNQDRLVNRCSSCGMCEPSKGTFKLCSACKKAGVKTYYCCVACATKDWKAGHKATCAGR
jgi:hypothetical protein